MSLRDCFATVPIQHIGINVEDMEVSKRFYADVLGGEFVTEIDGIAGAEWNVILNGTALSDGKRVPDLASGDVLHVAFYSFGNVAVELLRYYNKKTGNTFPGPVVDGNEQGPAGMHICFNLKHDVDATSFLAKLSEACAGMPNVTVNRPELFVLPKSGSPMDGWCLAFMTGPNHERIEFIQIDDECNATVTFNSSAEMYRRKRTMALEKQQAGPLVEHIVLMALKADATPEQLAAAQKEVFALRSVSGVVSLSFGPTTVPQRSRGYTHGLVIRHASAAAAASYQVDPNHVRVRDDVLGPLLDSSVAVVALDFDVDNGDVAATGGTPDERMHRGHENHMAAFASQDLERIMKDYTEQSVLVTYNKATGEDREYCGLEPIRAMFAAVFTDLSDMSGFEAVHHQVHAHPQGNSFLVWKCPSSGVEYATDTFVFDQDGKIRFQTFVGWFGTKLVSAEDERARVVSVPPDVVGVTHAHWDNHFAAFGAQDVQKILKDYNEQSKVVVHDKATNTTTEHGGVAAVQKLFTGLFASLPDLSTLRAPFIRVEEGNFPSVFLIWQCPSSGYVSVTDTFVFDSKGMISYQNIVVYSGAQ